MRVAIFLVMAPTSLYGQTQTPEGEATQFAQVNFDRPRDPQADYMNFVPDEVLVKFKDEVNIESGGRLKSLGIGSIDRIMNKYGITELQRVFPNAVKHRNKRIVRDPQGRDMVIPDLDNIFKLKVSLDRSSTGNMPQVFQVIEELKALPEVEYAEPNYLLRIGDFEPAGPVLTQEDIINDPDIGTEEGTTTGLVPNDPLYSQQWGIPACKIDEVWNTHTGDTTSIIAILDTGVDWLHPDLAPNIWQNPGEIPGNGFDDDANGKVDDIRGWDFINNDNNPADDNSHGTHCAGIAAAVGNNGIGIAGVNWNARIMPIKVFQSSGFGDAATIASGINYAANSGASVLNMSFGSYAESLTLKNALANAYATAVLVAAAGNDRIKIGPCVGCAPMFPAAFSFVFGIEANTDNSLALFSNFDQDGPVFSRYIDLHNYELGAPGENIISCVPGGNYRTYNGTSMATPIVAGSISLYQELHPIESEEIILGNFINSTNTHIDLDSALNVISKPILNIVSFELMDTIDGDNDGRADVGESIELKVFVRNTWGQADSVYVGVEFNEYEDPTTALMIQDTSFIGSISAYSTNTNQIPLKLKISDSIVDGRIINLNLITWFNNLEGKNSIAITLKVENGIELGGIITENLILTPDKSYIITESIAVPEGVSITIKPGTILKFSQYTGLIVSGTINAIGTKDSLIVFTKRDQDYNWQGVYIGTGAFNANYIKFEYAGTKKSGAGYIFELDNSNQVFISNSLFLNSSNALPYLNYGINLYRAGNINRSCFYYNDLGLFGITLGINGNSSYNNIISNTNHSWTRENSGILTSSSVINEQNCLFSNYSAYVNIKSNLSSGSSTGFNLITIDSTYYGTYNESRINSEILDFPELGGGTWFDISKKMAKPPIENHGIIWKIVVNDHDSQDEFDLLDPLGVGSHKYEIYFNRPMDVAITPLLSIGVRYPFTQTAINANGSWSADSTIYTVYGTVDLNTGDGINTIRGSGAQDTDHFEIPIEDRRFRVIVNAAGSASAGFQATPGLGKIELEWNNAGLADGLGFNMYRKTRINDSTISQPVLINPQLITDTLYTDFNVVPGQQYYYYYKILRTDLSETDSSRMVATIPLTASIGDANGDLTVNVLDITTIVAYLLNNNPQPFIYDAADVNADENINVLDIVGLVNLVMGNAKSGELVSNKMAYLYIENDTVFADVAVSNGGIQLELGGIGIEDVKALKSLSGFEFGYCSIDGRLRLLYYSMTGNTIPAGKRIPLLKLGKQAWIDAMILADTRGNAVPVEYKKPYEQIITEEIVLLGQNYPNPFTGETMIPVTVYQPIDKMVMKVVNMYGQIVAVQEIQSPKLGENLIRFNSIKNKGILTYILNVEYNGQTIRSKGLKMINR